MERFLTIGLLAFGLLPASHGGAPETVRWDDLSTKIPQLCDCEYTVVATSGEKYSGKRLEFKASEIAIPDAKASVKRESVAEIQIRHSRDSYHASEERKGLYNQACGHDEVHKCGASAVWVAPLAVTQTAVTALVTGVRNALFRLKPTKMIRVAP